MSYESTITFYIRNNLMSPGTATDNHGRIGFDFDNLEIKLQPVTQGKTFYSRNG